MEFLNQTAMITGAAVGIGRAVTTQLVKSGANVIALDVDAEKLAALEQELAEYSRQVLCVICDVRDPAAVSNAADQGIQCFGKIDILVNNAALWRHSSPFQEISLEDWKTFMDINVMGVVHCTRAVLPYMIENNYGRIVNVASVAGVYGNANMSHYSATKGAVIAMTKALAKELAQKGITVNAVSPGSVSTSKNPDMDFYKETGLAYMGRTGTDRENADLICFLASKKASYISGQNIQIDGCRKEI